MFRVDGKIINERYIVCIEALEVDEEGRPQTKIHFTENRIMTVKATMRTVMNRLNRALIRPIEDR